MKHKNYLQKQRIILSILILFGTLLFMITQLQAQVGINNSNPDASAALDITSTDKGLLIPRVSDHAAISSPATGLLVYDTTTDSFWYYNGTGWTELIATSPSGNFSFDGNLGIGVDPPTEKIEIESDDSDITLTTISTSDVSTLKFQLADGNETNVKNGDNLGNIRFQGYDGSAYVSGARIIAEATADAENGNMPTQLIFETSSGGGSLSKRMYIKEDGLIGINESSPQAMLHITKDQDDATRIRLDNTNQDNSRIHTALEFYDGSTVEALVGYNNFEDNLYISNNSTTNSDIIIGARNDVILRNEGVDAVTIRHVDSNPGIVNIAGLYVTGTGTGNRPVFVKPDGDLVAGDSGSKGPSANQEERITKLEKENQMLRERIEKLEMMVEGLVNSDH